MGGASLYGALILAGVLGWGADRLGIPGGLILGSMIGAAVVGLATTSAVEIPKAVETTAQILIGAAVGVQITRSSIASIGWMILPAVLAGVLIIAAGLGIAYLLKLMHIAPDGAVLATSPGALSALTGVALSHQDVNAVHVAIFHLVRIVMVLISLPVLNRLLQGDT